MSDRPHKQGKALRWAAIGAALALGAAVLLVFVLRGAGRDEVDTVAQLDRESSITLPTLNPASTQSGANTTVAPKNATTRSTTRPPATTRQRDESGLPIVTVAQLPKEAQRVLQLIDKGGPFDYDRDGITFENREGLLPKQPKGYYKEYTVKTPGESDRGARRIVAGQKGERYYTADHYDSFVRVQL